MLSLLLNFIKVKDTTLNKGLLKFWRMEPAHHKYQGGGWAKGEKDKKKKKRNPTTLYKVRSGLVYTELSEGRIKL